MHNNSPPSVIYINNNKDLNMSTLFSVNQSNVSHVAPMQSNFESEFDSSKEDSSNEIFASYDNSSSLCTQSFTNIDNINTNIDNNTNYDDSIEVLYAQYDADPTNDSLLKKARLTKIKEAFTDMGGNYEKNTTFINICFTDSTLRCFGHKSGTYRRRDYL